MLVANGTFGRQRLCVCVCRLLRVVPSSSPPLLSSGHTRWPPVLCRAFGQTSSIGKLGYSYLPLTSHIHTAFIVHKQHTQ